MLENLNFVVALIVFAGGLGYWKRIGMTVKQMAVFSLVTGILIATVHYGIYAVTSNAGHGKEYFAIAAAAFTLALTIYGEYFNAPLEKCEKIKLRSSQWKAWIAIFRSFTIFVCTVIYFLPRE